MICAAKKISTYQELTHCYLLNKYQQILVETDNYLDWVDLPRDCAVALVDLTDCIRMTPTFISQQSSDEIDCGDWSVGRFAWKLENIKRIMPSIPIIGRQGLFNAQVELKEEKLEVIAL